MTSTDDILNQIDNALEDGTVGPDGMRSRPAPEPAAASGQRLWIAPLGTTEDGDGWQEIGHVTDIDIHEYFARIQAERVRRAQAAIYAFIQAMTAAIAPVAESACRDMSEAAKAFRHLPEAEGCDDCGTPAPPRDRPAWQSPYGPPRRRR